MHPLETAAQQKSAPQTAAPQKTAPKKPAPQKPSAQRRAAEGAAAEGAANRSTTAQKASAQRHRCAEAAGAGVRSSDHDLGDGGDSRLRCRRGHDAPRVDERRRPTTTCRSTMFHRPRPSLPSNRDDRGAREPAERCRAGREGRRSSACAAQSRRRRSSSGSSTVSPGRSTPTFQEPQRYGESVVREILGASFIEEQPVQPGGTR